VPPQRCLYRALLGKLLAAFGASGDVLLGSAQFAARKLAIGVRRETVAYVIAAVHEIIAPDASPTMRARRSPRRASRFVSGS
jgi:hypothetical protein